MKLTPQHTSDVILALCMGLMALTLVLSPFLAHSISDDHASLEFDALGLVDDCGTGSCDCECGPALAAHTMQDPILDSCLLPNASLIFALPLDSSDTFHPPSHA